MPSRFRFARSVHGVSAVVMLLLALSDARPAAAQGLTMTAALEFSQTYRPDSWQPVRIQFRNDTDQPVDGTAVLPLSYPGSHATMQLPISVPARANVTATVWGYFPPPPELTTAQKRSGRVPPLTIVEWRGPDGAMLARTEILGVPISASSKRDDAAAEHAGERGELVLLVSERADPSGDAHDVEALLGHLSNASGLALAVAGVSRDALPWQAAALRTVRAVVLEGVDPELLDQSQRSALLDYLRGGGIVVVSAPIGAVARSGSWFEHHFPVRLIGSRVASQIETSPDGAALKLRESLPIIEAIDAGGDVLLRGRDYVHVATKSVGLGKVVFTSFPLNGLAESQPQVAVLWEELLGVRRPLWDWNESQLGETRHAVLGAMIGRKVAPWSVAAAVAVGYVLLIALAQVLFLGPARPKAFAASVGVAFVVSGALLAMGMVRRGESGLQSARVAVVDLSGDGRGWQQESVAFVGADDPKMALCAADERVMIRPALADAGNRPTVRQQPFAVDEAGVYAERIERVWEAAGPADPTWRISAFGQVGSNGLTLDVDNGLGRTIESPLVIWNGRALAFADLPPGRTTVRDVRVNARQQFTGLGVITSDQARRRAQIVAASLAPANPLAVAGAAADVPPMLIGWIADAGPSLLRPVDRKTVESKSMAMVRTPLRFHVAPPGSAVSIPAALVRVDIDRFPYDVEKGESVATPQPGDWKLGFRASPQLGRVRPAYMTLSARVTLPAHRMLVRKGSAPGAVVAEWSREVGAKEIRIDCTPGDYDADGTVWITLEVTSHDAGGSVPWQVSDLGMSIEGEMIGPPPPVVLDAPRKISESARPKGEADAEEKQ